MSLGGIYAAELSECVSQLSALKYCRGRQSCSNWDIISRFRRHTKAGRLMVLACDWVRKLLKYCYRLRKVNATLWYKRGLFLGRFSVVPRSFLLIVHGTHYQLFTKGLVRKKGHYLKCSNYDILLMKVNLTWICHLNIHSSVSFRMQMPQVYG